MAYSNHLLWVCEPMEKGGLILKPPRNLSLVINFYCLLFIKFLSINSLISSLRESISLYISTNSICPIVIFL